jgi:hypothetical protein
MTRLESERVLGIDEMLDATRLASAWQVAHEEAGDPARDPTRDTLTDAIVQPIDDAITDATAGATTAPTAVPGPAAPLALPLAHRHVLDALDRLLAASPSLAVKARRVLAVPLSRLAAVIDPLDAPAAETALDDLEDLLQALLSAAGWPASGEE